MAWNLHHTATLEGLPREIYLQIYESYARDLVNGHEDETDWDSERLIRGDDGEFRHIKVPTVLQANEFRNPGKLFLPTECPALLLVSKAIHGQVKPVLSQFAKAIVSTSAETKRSRTGNEHSLYHHSSAIRLLQPPLVSAVRHLDYSWLIYLDVSAQHVQNREMHNRLNILKHLAPTLVSLTLNIRIDGNDFVNRDWSWMVKRLCENSERDMLLRQITDLEFPQLRRLALKGVFLSSWIDSVQGQLTGVVVLRGERYPKPLAGAEGSDAVELCCHEKIWRD